MHVVLRIRGSSDRMPAGQRARQRSSTAFYRVRQTPFTTVDDDSLIFHFIQNFLHFHQISSSFIFKFSNSILFYWVVANFLFEINTKSMVLQRPLSFPHHPTGKEVVKAIFQNSDSIGTRVNEFWPQLQRPKNFPIETPQTFEGSQRWNGMENFRSKLSHPFSIRLLLI